jgi:ankyrin repeat protein
MSIRSFVILIAFSTIAPLGAQEAQDPVPLPQLSASSHDLLIAALEGDLTAIQATLAAGADPQARDDEGNSALHLVMYERLWGKEMEVIEALLKAGLSLETKNYALQTPLLIAAREGRDQSIAALVAKGAAINVQDVDGWSALTMAAFNGQKAAIEQLLAAKADHTLRTLDGWDPLLIALTEGRGSAAAALVAGGAEIRAREGSSPPLILATFSADLESVRLVLAKKADLAARDRDGWSALAIAANNGWAQMVMEFLRAGMDPALKDNEGKTALDRARANGHKTIATLLGDPWLKPETKGQAAKIPCPDLNGEVTASIDVMGEELTFWTAYTKPLPYYLGGGLVNRAPSAIKYTYDALLSPTFHIDTDFNRETGRKGSAEEPWVAGSEVSLEYSEYATSSFFEYEGAGGELRTKAVLVHVLAPRLKQLGEDVDPHIFGEFHPTAADVDGVLMTKVPWPNLGAKAGQKLRVAVRIGGCGPAEIELKLPELDPAHRVNSTHDHDHGH